MTRPVYETVEDRTHEDEVARFVCSRWGLRPCRLPSFYVADRAGLKGDDVAAWLEVKWRNQSYRTYRISLHKWMRLLELSEHTHLPAYVVVSWPVNGERIVIVHRCSRLEHRIVMGGRWDRNDANDIEPMVEIGVEHFTREL